MNAPPAQSPFTIPAYRSLWTAILISNMGFMIQSVGAAWLMTTITHSPRMVALVQSSVALPLTLLSLFAGAIADNLDRRRIMIAAQTFMLCVSGVLTGLTYFGLLTPVMLLTMTFLIGCGTAINAPAWQASVGDLVPRETLPAAVAYNSVSFNIARSVGPALGGAIVAAAGAAAAFIINCFSYLGLIVALIRWRSPEKVDALPPERIGNAISGGLRYVMMSPHMLRILLRGLVFGCSASAIPSLMPLVARDLLAGNSITYGIMLGSFGLGAVSGALTGPRLRRRWSINMIVGTASLALAAGAAITGLSTTLFVAIPALFLGGWGWILAMSTLMVTVQLTSPRWVVARAISTHQMITFGGMAGGSWLFGTVAGTAGITNALFLAASMQIAGVLIGLFVRLPDVEDLNLDPLARWTEPSTAVPVEARSGPVVITIRYLIDQADIPEFLSAMSERRRVRLRDGARRWTLYRDLSDQRLWIERYHVPTWLDYVRHNQRRTHADIPHSDRLRSLHRGSEPPKVDRMIQLQPGTYGVQAIDDETIARGYTDHP